MLASRGTATLVAMTLPSRWSLLRLSRTAGILDLVNILGGAFGIGYVSATAPTVGVNELLFRAGVLAHVIVTLTNVPIAMIFYELFKVASHRGAMLIAFFTLVATAIEGASLLDQVAHPVVEAYDVYTLFFAFYALVIGYLIYSSRLMPRAIGALMVVDGISYLVYGVSDILAPGFASHLVPWAQLPILAGEGSLCVWLLLRGVSVERWTALRQATETDAASPAQV